MALLDTLDEFKDRLDKKTVADKVWPHLVRNFSAYQTRANPDFLHSKPDLQIPWPLSEKRQFGLLALCPIRRPHSYLFTVLFLIIQPSLATEF